MPVIAPEEPQLALARGAALASANAPRYDTTTVGLAYSQDPDGTTVYPLALSDEATTFLRDAASSLDTADIVSDPDDVPERSKPFLLMGSSLTAIFAAGMTALAIAMAISVQPTADQGPDGLSMPPGAAAPPPLLQIAPPTAPQQVPKTVPAPAPAAPPLAANATARLKVPPAPPPPPVLVRSAAPAPAAPPPAPAAPPPFVVPPAVIAPPLIQWLPPILQPPPFFNPGPRGPLATAVATVAGGMGTAVVTRAASRRVCHPSRTRRIAVGNGRGDRSAQRATGHSPSSDVVSMMRPSATQAAP